MKYIYLHGFASSVQSAKARYFSQRFAERGIHLHIPELDRGDFEHLTITGQLDVIRREAAAQEAVLIGSSMGGYLAALHAARDPSIQALVLLAPAFCMARRWPDLFGHDRMNNWKRTGSTLVFHHGYKAERELSYELISDASQYEDFPAFTQPALILHGRHDPVVPAALSENFAQSRKNVRVILYESGHELTDVLEQLILETLLFLDIPVP